MPETPWPMNIDDPVRAVHFLLERDCPWQNPASCPTELRVKQTLEAHSRWRKARIMKQWSKLIAQAESYVDDQSAFIEVYREAHDKGAPDEVIAILDRIQATSGGKL